MIKYKIVGNMLWNNVDAVPPRQVTPVEREMVTEIEFWHRQFDALSHILRAEEQNLALDLAAQKAMEAVDAAKFLPPTFYADRAFTFRVRQLVRIWQNAVTANATLESDMARVRGLLQRAKDAIYDQICPVSKTELTKDLQLRSVWNELAAETQGAESADIGKLDRGDKKHVCGMAGFNMLLGDTCPPCEARLAGSA
jgi:hypothetical protein